MQQKGFVTALAGIIALVLIVIVLGAFGYFIYNRVSSDETEIVPVESPVINLGSNSSVEMFVRGPIVAPEKHYEYLITVTPDSREMNVYQGYTFERINSTSLGNTDDSYEQFVFALERLGLDENRDTSSDDMEMRGICPNGYLYVFTALEGNRETGKWWRGSCNGAEGNFETRPAGLVDLFREQIPSSRQLLEGTRFR